MTIEFVYNQIPVLFWMTMILLFISILPMLIFVYVALFESINLSPKLFNPHLVPKNKNNERAGDVQEKQRRPGNPQFSINSQSCDANDPDDNHGSRASSL